MANKVINNQSEAKAFEKKLEAREAIKEKELLKFMATEGGRAFFWDLMGKAGTFAMSGGSLSTNTVMYNNGKRDFGLLIWGELESVNVDAVFKMRKENSDE